MHLSRAELFELFEVILPPFQTDNKETMIFVLLMQLDADPIMGRWRKTSQRQARMQMRVSSYKFCLNDIILIK